MTCAIVHICVLALLPHGAFAITLSQRTDLRPEEDLSMRTHEEALAKAGTVIAKMTFEEKVSFLHGAHFSILGGGKPEDGYYTGNVDGIPRLGVPALKMADAGNGFRPTEEYAYGTTTSWPCLLALGSTWDRDLVGQVAEALGEEFRGKGANVILGPSINVHRSARGGRNFEYMSGEDPYLGASLASAYVEHVQKKGVMSMPKHFAFNEQETHRMTENSIVDEQTAWELYYPPFEAAARAGAGAVMCAYNRVNGTYACENPKMEKTDLREKMGFTGFVTSDWFATHTPRNIGGGEDMEMPGADPMLGALNLPQVNSPKLLRKRYSDQDISNAAQHILTSIYRMRLDEHPSCLPGHCEAELRSNVSTPEHLDLAATAATHAVTLLKNDAETLPITPEKYKTIAIIGEYAYEDSNMTTSFNRYNGGGSGAVPAAFVKVPAAEIAAPASAMGITVINCPHNGGSAAMDAAKKADLVIVLGGGTSSEGIDRFSLHLDGDVDQLISDVSLIKPTVVLMQTPGVVIMPWRYQVSAILNLFLAGQETGTAWKNVLWGYHNPTGKLPIMMPEDEFSIIEPGRERNVPYEEGMLTSYRNPNLRAAFPFGHGLSYTSFKYGPIQVISKPATSVTLSLNITNTGHRSGSDTVQAYLEFPEVVSRNPQYPKMQLRGFEKTGNLSPGESKLVTLRLEDRDLSSYNVAKGGWEMQKLVRVHVGASSGDIRQELELQW